MHRRLFVDPINPELALKNSLGAAVKNVRAEVSLEHSRRSDATHKSVIYI